MLNYVVGAISMPPKGGALLVKRTEKSKFANITHQAFESIQSFVSKLNPFAKKKVTPIFLSTFDAVNEAFIKKNGMPIAIIEIIASYAEYSIPKLQGSEYKFCKNQIYKIEHLLIQTNETLYLTHEDLKEFPKGYHYFKRTYTSLVGDKHWTIIKIAVN